VLTVCLMAGPVWVGVGVAETVVEDSVPVERMLVGSVLVATALLELEDDAGAVALS